MNRFECPMAEYVGDEIYCGYYDVFYMKCLDNKDCPEEQSEDEEYYDIYNE